MKLFGLQFRCKSYGELAVDADDDPLVLPVKDNLTTDIYTYHQPAYIAVALIVTMLLAAVLLPIVIMSFGTAESLPQPSCEDSCRIELVESIPENLTYPAGSPSHMSTFQAWQTLIDEANISIDIASFYWTMRPGDVYTHPSDWQGEVIYQALLTAGQKRGIKLRIAQNQPTKYQPNKDTSALEKLGIAEVKNLNFTQWYNGGILHTKLWVVDNRHIYVGSANMDWRSLTQVKEMGVLITDCPCLATDMQKIFDVYWYLGRPHTPIPTSWPAAWATQYNKDTPQKVTINGQKSLTYFSSAPPEFCPLGRTSDIDSILDVINKAEKYIHIAVMDYFPSTLYAHPMKFWPVIDDALRHAALERKVEVHLMASCWSHTRPEIINYLLSLAQLNGAHGANIQVKLFHVPSTPDQAKIPFGRVNHNKYMVTDNTAYIGTSNWSADYFIQTGGIGFIVQNTNSTMTNNSTKTLQQQLSAVFTRDWDSEYALTVAQARDKCSIGADTLYSWL